MGRHSQEKKAQMENSLARFLVEWCEEGAGMEIKGSDLQAIYVIWHRKQNKLGLPSEYLDLQQLYRLLELAEFTKDVREEPTPRGRKLNVTYWRGLRVNQELLKDGRRFVDSKHDLPGRTSRDSTRSTRATKQITHSTNTHNTNRHILLGADLYDWDLISTIRRIKPFVDSRNGQEKCFIVTFKNPQINHVYVSREDGEKALLEARRMA